MIELHPELARTIVNDLPAGIAVIDNAGRVVWGNIALSELLQRDASDIIGRSAESLTLPIPPSDEQDISNGKTSCSREWPPDRSVEICWYDDFPRSRTIGHRPGTRG